MFTRRLVYRYARRSISARNDSTSSNRIHVVARAVGSAEYPGDFGNVNQSDEFAHPSSHGAYLDNLDFSEVRFNEVPSPLPSEPTENAVDSSRTTLIVGNLPNIDGSGRKEQGLEHLQLLYRYFSKYGEVFKVTRKFSSQSRWNNPKYKPFVEIVFAHPNSAQSALSASYVKNGVLPSNKTQLHLLPRQKRMKVPGFEAPLTIRPSPDPIIPLTTRYLAFDNYYASRGDLHKYILHGLPPCALSWEYMLSAQRRHGLSLGRIPIRGIIECQNGNVAARILQRVDAQRAANGRGAGIFGSFGPMWVGVGGKVREMVNMEVLKYLTPEEGGGVQVVSVEGRMLRRPEESVQRWAERSEARSKNRDDFELDAKLPAEADSPTTVGTTMVQGASPMVATVDADNPKVEDRQLPPSTAIPGESGDNPLAFI
ncbi:hypothetical protein DL96DRAFT_1717477 [Flagelloscypha sp. PMI_526]|nr:hypothetical protein DL96DRAFT_1717477 [Flagelloscypha sp. PMI_526]